MTVKSGIDIVYIPRFKKSLKRGGENFLRRVFNNEEVSRAARVPRVSRGEKGSGTFIQHLAGIFAAKEAVIKALNLPIDSWHDILIAYKPNGAPQVQMSSVPAKRDQMSNVSLSISHDGNYVIAQFFAILKQ